MPTKISSKEVLAYLNHLGYNNVNAQQLKEFIQDLKKLIKYEERKRREDNIFQKDTSVPTEITEHNGTSDNGTCEEPITDLFSALHAHGTIASKAKVVPKKESVISVQIKKSKPQIRYMEHNKENVIVPEAKKSQYSKKSEELNDKSIEEKDNKVEERQDIAQKSSQTNTIDSNYDRKKISAFKAKSSFIRPSVQMNNKSDPVALYHQYCAGWKRYKIPGEDDRRDLRWSVREKMLSGPR